MPSSIVLGEGISQWKKILIPPAQATHTNLETYDFMGNHTWMHVSTTQVVLTVGVGRSQRGLFSSKPAICNSFRLPYWQTLKSFDFPLKQMQRGNKYRWNWWVGNGTGSFQLLKCAKNYRLLCKTPKLRRESMTQWHQMHAHTGSTSRLFTFQNSIRTFSQTWLISSRPTSSGGCQSLWGI